MLSQAPVIDYSYKKCYNILKYMTNEKYTITPGERLDYDFQIDDWEWHATEHRFDSLLELATETCLREPLAPIERVVPTNDQRIVSMGGLHALRIALELELKQELWPNYDPVDDKELAEGKFWVQLDTPLRLHDETRDPINFTIAKKVEQFGKALIDEAFDVLGPDANVQVEKMRGGDHAEQIEVIRWLANRITSMKDHVPPENGDAERDGPDENGAYLYHPIRLSPKAVGVYPDMKILPTCLAVSTIVSSFFEKAGMTYMHGGVAMTGFGGRMSDGMMLFDSVEKMTSIREGNDWPSPLIADKMLIGIDHLYSQMTEDNGYHAAVMVRLVDGQWVMVDPYAGIVDEAFGESNKDYERIYQTLDEFRETAPGLELSCQGGMLTIEGGLKDVVSKGLAIMKQPEAIGNMLKEVVMNHETGRDKIYNDYILPHFKSIAEQDKYPDAASVVNTLLNYSEGIIDQNNQISDLVREVAESVAEGASEHSDGLDNGVPDLLREAFDEALWKYVFWGEKREVVMERMSKDTRYLANRIVDMTYLPSMMCATIASRNLRENILGTIGHEKMEFGLPYSRIGYSVLSDFASYTDDELPPSFWFAHWASLVPVTETLPRGGTTQHQRDLQEFMANWTRMKYLTYIKAYPIISEFLTALSSEEEEQHGGSTSSE